MTVGMLLLLGATAFLARERTVVEALVVRSEGLATVRIARHVVAEDIGAGEVVAWSADSVAIRAVRGAGPVCGAVAPWLHAAVEGAFRAPDPEKDSVRVLDEGGRWHTADLLDTRSGRGSCPSWGDARVVSLQVDPWVPRPVAVRYFERGSYHLAGDALRYRRGRAGRQPLSPEVLRRPHGFEGDTLPHHLNFTLDSAAHAWRLRLRP